VLYGWSLGEPARRIARLIRESITQEALLAQVAEWREYDVSGLLPEVISPTLVLHRRDHPVLDVNVARRLASRIQGARLVLLEGSSLAPYLGDTAIVESAIDEFLGQADALRPAQPYGGTGAFRTILWTDLVDHTQMMSRLGDERGRAVLREHERITREVLKAHGGTEVKTMGDGFMASFGSVTKAVECAIALQKAIDERNRGVGARHSEPLSTHDGSVADADDLSDKDALPHASPLRAPVETISVRVGLNAGEPIEEDGDLFGATVILASRIAARADGGEILVADTVRGLCSGKGFLFSDRGEHPLKGFEEPVRVYEVRWREA
jgi:class 3 adenylate cyclase